MSLYFLMVFLELFSKTTVTLLYDVILVPPSQYCTSLCYLVVLLSIIMLYFNLSQYCTSLCHNIVLPSVIILFFHHDSFLCKIMRGRILSKTEYSYFLFLLLCTSDHYNVVLLVIKVIFRHIYEGPCVFP
jgi:hypothetical protein